ncbi:hypothetical protein TNCV_2159281 [Trichonephila clavipes]|nr:hypothetical protein TNCV_2159281 [Trichonephila clavipes]
MSSLTRHTTYPLYSPKPEEYQRQIDTQGIFYMSHNHMTSMPTIFTSRKSIDYSRDRVSERILTSNCSATQVLLATDQVILNHGQVTRATPKPASPLLPTTLHQQKDV